MSQRRRRVRERRFGRGLLGRRCCVVVLAGLGRDGRTAVTAAAVTLAGVGASPGTTARAE